MTEIDEALVSISKLDLDAGPAAGRTAARLVELIARQTTELEACIELSRDHGWGHRIVNQRKALANIVEGRLREAEKTSAAALPTELAGSRRMPRKLPRLSVPPERRAVVRAMTLLTFTQEIRTSASYAGFSAAHAKAIENVAAMLDQYVEDVLDSIRHEDAADRSIVDAYLKIAADFCELVSSEKAAALFRRRAALARHGEVPAKPDGWAG